ncbi:MAG: hypothetical protein IPL52_14950 [Flavobacteriales bacterium]|nr:hypothetical protein [Flavobacteriales bacterium]
MLVEQNGAVGSTEWPANQLPIWVDNSDPNMNLFDWDVPTGTATGLLTRYFQDASSGHFNVVADYLLAPDNGGIFHTSSSSVSTIINTVNAALGTNIVTGHGFTSVTDFDKWETSTTATGPGLPKIPGAEPNGVYDHVMFIYRTSGWNNNTGYASSSGLPVALLGHQANTYSFFYSHKDLPIDIMRHEFSHMLYGGNNFHTGGGGWAGSGIGEYFINMGCGWSNMGLANGSLNSWNAWDRQRMGWYGVTSGVDNVYPVSARDANNAAEVNGDLDATVPSGAGIYTLRDFVNTGDAIRIKLPFTDPSAEYPEFLWVENHQGRDQNANPFDKWQYEGDPCIEGVVPGLQMYVQIDKEVREASSSTPIYSGPGDHIRPLDANGHVDETFETTTQLNTCICWLCPKNPFVRGLPNPLTGTADRHWVPLDGNADNHISTPTLADSPANTIESSSGTYQMHAYDLGNSRQVFTPGGNHKLGIGTNPSSATMMNLVGWINNIDNQPNLRRIYLNGVSVEILSQNADGSITVQVRFDDVDVSNDARWCADEIQLNPVVTSTGYSLNITTGNTLLLDRGTTATQRDATPVLYNGQQVFNMPTLMRCTNGTLLNMEGGSQLIVDNGSTLRLESGSRLDLMSGSDLHVRNGGKFEIMPGAVLNVANGARVRIEEGPDPSLDGRLIYHPGAIIHLDGTTSELAFAGVLEIKDNATFQVVSNTSPFYTKGTIRFHSTRVPSQNVVAGSNSRFVVRSNSFYQRVLYVDQESLYGPVELVEFTSFRYPQC